MPKRVADSYLVDAKPEDWKKACETCNQVVAKRSQVIQKWSESIFSTIGTPDCFLTHDIERIRAKMVFVFGWDEEIERRCQQRGTVFVSADMPDKAIIQHATLLFQYDLWNHLLPIALTKRAAVESGKMTIEVACSEIASLITDEFTDTYPARIEFMRRVYRGEDAALAYAYTFGDFATSRMTRMYSGLRNGVIRALEESGHVAKGEVRQRLPFESRLQTANHLDKQMQTQDKATLDRSDIAGALIARLPGQIENAIQNANLSIESHVRKQGFQPDCVVETSTTDDYTQLRLDTLRADLEELRSQVETRPGEKAILNAAAELAGTNDDFTQTDIAQKAGVSQERVSQAFKAMRKRLKK